MNFLVDSMTEIPLEDWIEDEAKRRGCKIVGFTEINERTRLEFIQDDLLINGKPANSVIILGMILDDPILDVWTQSPSWPAGKNYIDEALARVATVIAWKLTIRGFPSRTFRYGDAYLKHLAVYAGLGNIGRNNLLISPQYGPHIRLRGLLTRKKLSDSQRLDEKFNPCAHCPDLPPCISACPAGAFKDSSESIGNVKTAVLNITKPRSGYDKFICREYSEANLQRIDRFSYLWCRACEEACPIGNKIINRMSNLD